MAKLYFNYDKAKEACQQFGLQWFGDDYQPLIDADAEAYVLGFNQAQVDAAMRNTLWHVKVLFTPSYYPYWTRIKLAFYFLFSR